MNTVIKYENRKLYDKNTSKYVTLKELLTFPLGSFKVISHKSKKEETANTLFVALANPEIEKSVKMDILKYCLKDLSW